MSDELRVFTRRDLLRAAGMAGAAVVTAPAVLPVEGGSAEVAPASPQAQSPSASREPFEHLTATEADLVEGIAERLIPSDANGPGAREARVVRYIDRALGGALASSRQAYATGLSAVDRYAQTTRGKPFLQLSAADQDAVLSACEKGQAAGFEGAAQFFAMILGHTRQGMFGDPYYGGNANFVGWDLIGYPGVRTNVAAADQKALENRRLKPTRKSAYDFDAFTKATARHDAHGGRLHGD